MELFITPSNGVQEDADAQVVLVGDPNRSVEWSLTGPGTLTPVTNHTDQQGRAFATYTPGTAGDLVTITADYGT